MAVGLMTNFLPMWCLFYIDAGLWLARRCLAKYIAIHFTLLNAVESK